MYRTYQTPKSRMAFFHLAKESSGEGYHWTSLFHLQAGCNDCLGYKRRANYLHSDDQFTAGLCCETPFLILCPIYFRQPSQRCNFCRSSSCHGRCELCRARHESMKDVSKVAES